MMQLTGKTRWRSQRRFFGREELVLQVEWAGTEVRWNGYYADSEDASYWRDARSEDIAGLRLSFTSPPNGDVRG